MEFAVTSWLVPGGWLDNLRVAADLGWVSGVELLLFSFEGGDRELFLRELPEIVRTAAAAGISLSVHLPDPLLPRHEEIVAAMAGGAECLVVHPPRDAGEAAAPAGALAGPNVDSWADMMDGWRRAWGDRFLLEYTAAADFVRAEAALPGLPLCADTGRLLLEGLDPANWIAERAERIREIHLHGTERIAEGNGVADADRVRDHRPPRGDEAWLSRLAPGLAAFRGRTVLEVFSLGGVEAARAGVLAALARCKEWP